MKILIISYYGLRESLFGASKELENKGHDIYDYPLMEKRNDLGSEYIHDLITYISILKPDIILWWHLSISTKEFEKIVKSNNAKNIYFNWDDPFNYKIVDLENKAKYIDIAFITCKETIEKYMKDGTRKAICLYPGFDPLVHYPIIEDIDLSKYSCDISICCTNLYNDEIFSNQYVKRKDLIDKIYDRTNIYNYKFYIYGPEFLKEIYPDSYRGFAKYENTNKIFNYSKINICTHAIFNKEGYLNERTILILASGGLLFVDNVKGIEKELKHMDNCFIFNKDTYFDEILNILSNYDNFWLIRHNAFMLSKKYEWSKWADVIHNEIIK